MVASAVLALWFVVQTVLFLLETASATPSFAEAAKKLLLFAMRAFAPGAILCGSVVFSGVSIKLAAQPRKKKIARALFVGEMVMLGIYALLLLSMFVAFPEEWI